MDSVHNALQQSGLNLNRDARRRTFAGRYQPSSQRPGLERSSAAAKEIKQLIDTSVERVQSGTSLVDETGRTVTEIIGAVRRVTDIMGEIAAASEEQSSGIEQVARAVTQMEVTQQNAALVEEAAPAAQSLEDQAGALRTAVATFRLHEGTPPGIAPVVKPKAKAPAVAASRAAPGMSPTPIKSAADGPRPEAVSVGWETF